MKIKAFLFVLALLLSPAVFAQTVTSQSTATAVIVHGTGFVPGSVIQQNGAPCVTTFVNATELTGICPSALFITVPATFTLTVTGTASVHSVTATWTPSISKGVTAYNLKRSTISGGPYTLVAQLASTATTATDTNVVAGAKYFYIVTASSPTCPATPTCGESVVSNQVTATVPSP
jgi:hypothetical protein